MKRIAVIFNIWMISALAPAWDGARIEKVDAYSNQAKSSVVIFYSGVEKLRFFAIDSADGLLTLDFPGVYSEFDFSGLNISQVEEVVQVPLDPDVSKGISVRFHLKPGASYDIFDGGSGELTILFETGAVSEPVVAVAADPEPAPQDVWVPEEYNKDNHRVINGSAGPGLLSQVVFDAGETTGQVRLFAAGAKDYRTFYLDTPSRFVLDLKQTALSLAKEDLALDTALIEKVRIKQFQSAPDPIVRMVLDLNQRIEVKVVEEEGGLLLVYAANQLGLQNLLARINDSSNEVPVERDEALVASSVEDSVESVDGTVVEATTPTDEIDPDAAMAAFDRTPEEETDPIASMEKVVDPVPSVMLKNEDAPPTVSEEAEAAPVVDALEPKPTENAVAMAEAQDEPFTSQPVEDETVAEEMARDEEVAVAAAEPDAVPVSEEPALKANPKPVVEEEPMEVAASESDPVENEVEVVEVAASESIVASEPVAEEPVVEEPEVTAYKAEVDVEPVASSEAPTVEEEDTPMEPEPIDEAKDTPIVSVEPQDSSEPEPVEEPVYRGTGQSVVYSGPQEETDVDREMAVFGEDDGQSELSISEAGDMSETPVASSEEAKPVFMDESTVAKSKPEDLPALPREEEAENPWAEDVALPKFEMAGDVDTEMRDFLNEEPDKSFYGMMKDVRSTRREIGRVVVTNTSIENSKRLGEMRSMQEDGQDGEGGEEEDFSALFQAEEDLGVETLTGEEKDYKGFEISIIDVKDADVVDLLRFIADQVGINLYVDSSVPALTATYRFRNIPWDQALEIILANANLDKEFRNGVLRVATMQKFKDEEQARADLRKQRENNVPRETVTFSLNYAKAEEVLPLVENYLSDRGNILMDERTNMLIIQDIPTRMVTIRALIKKLDRMIAQVSIEARLVETTKRFLRELGIQWGLSAEYSPELGTETGLDFPNRFGVGGPNIGGSSPGGLQGGYAVNLPVVSENTSGIGLTLGNFLDNFKLDVSLQMLESEGFGQIISSPKITTQNNKTALIKNGQKVPIQTIQRGTVTVTYIDAVLELQVTPHITSDETVIMEVVVDKSEPDFTRTVDGNPVINIRRAETKVLVKNGGTAVIGGIFTLNEQNSEDGIPGLRKIPFLEKLFSHELNSYENQELLIFVTPRIVKY